MSQTVKLPECDSKERRCATDLEPSERDHCTDDVDHQDNHSDGQRMAQGDRRKRREDSRSRALLQPERHRKEPSHARVQTVPGAQQDQSEPGPRCGNHKAAVPRQPLILQLLTPATPELLELRIVRKDNKTSPTMCLLRPVAPGAVDVPSS